MHFDPLIMIRDLMHAGGINFHRLAPPYEHLSKIDGGLRSQLYDQYDDQKIIDLLKESCRSHVLYLAMDSFKTHYFIFREPFSPDSADEDIFIVIGPYLAEPYQDIIPSVMKNHHLPLFKNAELKDYYCGVPLIPDSSVLESEMIILLRYVFDTTDFVVDRTGLDLNKAIAGSKLQLEPSDQLSMFMIEERYKNEDSMLEAVEHGDLQTAMRHMSAFRKFQIEPRNTDLLRNYKNFLFVLNTLLRKAVQKADVHPAYIDRLSSQFAIQIEASRSFSDLSGISQEMLRKYCFLVQNYSLRGYSQTIQSVINYISFHLEDPLPLKRLAEIANVNPSSLSTRFKKETKVTLTDFINQKRIEQSIILLNTTDLPIHKIAEKVGILDENYFSRLFRKYMGMAPREYRLSIRDGSNVI